MIASTGPISYPAFQSCGYNAWGVAHDREHVGLGGKVGYSDSNHIWTVTRENEVLNPSDMVALGDGFQRSSDPKRDGYHGALIVWSLVSPWASTWSDWSIPPKKQPTYINHRGRFNRIFCDGHVESEDMNKPFERTEAYMRRWNKDYQPHREFWRP